MATETDQRDGTRQLAAGGLRPEPRFSAVYPNNHAVTSAYFGMHYSKLPTDNPGTPWHDLGQGSMRLWDTGTNWRHVEVRKGRFRWRRLDAYFDMADAHGQRVLLTLGQPPNWATASPRVSEGDAYNAAPPDNDVDWTDYVGAVVSRYAGKIDIEIWNEPAVRQFYTGTVKRLVELTQLAYETAKAIDTNCTVVAPPVSHGQYLSRMCQEGISQWVDAFGFHYSYQPNPPEDWFADFEGLKTTAASSGAGDIPFWNTEYTYTEYYKDGRLVDDRKPMPGGLASAYLARMLICNAVAGVARTFFYGMDYRWSIIRLIDYASRSRVLEAGRAFAYVAGLLADATLGEFSFDRWRGVYSVKIASGGNRYVASWARDDRTATLDMSGVTALTDVFGGELSYEATYTVGNSPVFARL